MFGMLAAMMVIGVLVTAIATVLVLVLLQVLGNKARGVKAKLFEVEAMRSITLDCDAQEAARRCRAALLQLEQGCELRSQPDESTEIIAKTSLSWKSAGEVLTIRLAADPGGGTGVDICSAPWFTTTMFDWGINAANVEFVARHLLADAAPRD